jgi:NCS1 family nucleobase:cation symporter-1
MFCDMMLHRKQSPARIEHLLYNRKYANWAGLVPMAVGMGVSVQPFSNRTEYIGLVSTHWTQAT